MCQGRCDVMTRKKKRPGIVNSGNGESTGISQLCSQVCLWVLSHSFLVGVFVDVSIVRFRDRQNTATV
jgi:hypothetical protein